MIGKAITQKNDRADNPKMLGLQEPEQKTAALVDQKQPVLARGVVTRNDGAPKNEEKRKRRLRAALDVGHQFRMCLTRQQVHALGVGKNHLGVVDVLEACQSRGQRRFAARFVSLLGILYL